MTRNDACMQYISKYSHPYSTRRLSIFTKPWGKGYPTREAKRKIKNNKEVKVLNQLTKKL